MSSTSRLQVLKTVRKTSAILLSIGLLTTTLAACSKSDVKNDVKSDSNSVGDTGSTNHVLRIGAITMAPSQKESLRKQIAEKYEMKHPEMEIEIVTPADLDLDPANKPSTKYGQIKELLTGSNPVDVMYFEYGDYLDRAIQDNLLKQLDPLIQESKFDIDDFAPGMLDGLRDIGDGNLYALAPAFSSRALLYNKKLFTDAGVPFPTDKMSWDEAFDLARRVSSGEGDKRIFGFSPNTWVSSGNAYNDKVVQLKEYDNKAENMLVDTPQWSKMMTDLNSLYKDKVIPMLSDVAGDPNPYMVDMFKNGRTAMVLADNTYINGLVNPTDDTANTNNVAKLDWDIVALPVLPEEPNAGSGALFDVMAINAKAQNTKGAWDLIQFDNSKEMAKLNSRIDYLLPTRISFLQPKDGMDYNMAAFYTAKPAPRPSWETELFGKYPNFAQVDELGRRLLQDVADSKITVEQALKEWQTKGDAFLKDLQKDPKATIFEVTLQYSKDGK